MRLLPVGRSIDLRYECHICNSSIWLSEKESGTNGFKVICPLCQHTHEIEPVIASVRVTPLTKLEDSIWTNNELVVLATMYKRSWIEEAVKKLGKFKRFTEDDIKKIVLLIEEEHGIIK